MQVLTIERASREPGYALDLRYQQKKTKYGELCEAEGIVFYPLVVETVGGWHEVAVSLLRKLGVSLARSSGQEEGEVVRHIFGRLSVLLMKGNTALLLIPSSYCLFCSSY